MAFLALGAYAAYGIVDARWLGGVTPAPHWLRHPQAFNWLERILDTAMLTLTAAVVLLLWYAVHLARGPQAPRTAWRATRLPLIVLLVVAAAGVVGIGAWGPAMVFCVLAGWAVAALTGGGRTARGALLAATVLACCAALALVLYFAADGAVKAAWDERNEAAIPTLPVFPGATQRSTRIDYGPFVVSGSGGGESPGGLFLTRWWPPGLAYGSTVGYAAPPRTTSRAVMRWYRRKLGDGWRWKRQTIGVVAEGKRVGSIVEGTAESESMFLSFWNDGLAYGPDDPHATTGTSYEIVVWKLVPGVSYR